MIVIGIDAAVSARNIGVAIARWNGDGCELIEAFAGEGSTHMRGWLPARLRPWLEMEVSGLLAIDAPLGWPRQMQALVESNAGQSLCRPDGATDLFLRRTDQLIQYSSKRHRSPSALTESRGPQRRASSSLPICAAAPGALFLLPGHPKSLRHGAPSRCIRQRPWHPALECLARPTGLKQSRSRHSYRRTCAMAICLPTLPRTDTCSTHAWL